MTQPGNLVIRADAGPAMGIGHIMRCLALAQRWLDDGGRVTFACSELPEAIGERLREEGCMIGVINSPIGSASDAAATAGLASELAAAVVLDGYHFDADYQAKVRAAARVLLVLDDFGQIGCYAADLILDQNLGTIGDLYERRPEDSRLLLGARYTMLRSEFIDAAAIRRKPRQEVAGILVVTGGADIGGLAVEALNALNCIQGSLAVTVILGAAAATDRRLANLASSSHHRVCMVHNAADMPRLMADADLAVSCAGSTAWELAFMGVPSLLMPVAPNQELIASALADAGAAVVLDQPSRVGGSVSALIDDPRRRAEMSGRARALIDGEGSRRVVTTLVNPRDAENVAGEYSIHRNSRNLFSR